MKDHNATAVPEMEPPNCFHGSLQLTFPSKMFKQRPLSMLLLTYFQFLLAGWFYL